MKHCAQKHKQLSLGILRTLLAEQDKSKHRVVLSDILSSEQPLLNHPHSYILS